MTGCMTLIYRTQEPQHAPTLPVEISFRVYDTFAAALRIAPAYAAKYGSASAAKMVAKVATARRSYYCAVRGSRIVSDGWITRGSCKLYQIGAQDFVIGPIETVPSERGHGLAHACLVRAINHCLNRGAEWVYIDTTDDNYASRRTIEKSGMMLNRQVALETAPPQ